MITVSVQDILTKSIDELEALDPYCLGYCIYLIRDADTTLYIGRAKDPIDRLTQHFGRSKRHSGAAIGVFYQEHKDLSVCWIINIYTLEECEQILKQDLRRGESPHAEHLFIQHFRPCLNEKSNPNPSPLPERYQRRKLNLDNNAVDVLNF